MCRFWNWREKTKENGDSRHSNRWLKSTSSWSVSHLERQKLISIFITPRTFWQKFCHKRTKYYVLGLLQTVYGINLSFSKSLEGGVMQTLCTLEQPCFLFYNFTNFTNLICLVLLKSQMNEDPNFLYIDYKENVLKWHSWCTLPTTFLF